jgi:hypothetical protein
LISVSKLPLQKKDFKMKINISSKAFGNTIVLFLAAVLLVGFIVDASATRAVCVAGWLFAAGFLAALKKWTWMFASLFLVVINVLPWLT